MKRSRFIASALAALTAFVLPASASAQSAPSQSEWPNKAITFIVPYPAGGLNDAIVRVIGERMSAELGKPVLIDNKAGAATTVASNFVAKAAPDGYTLYGGGTSLIINPTLQGNVQYDPHKSFDLVSLISFTPFILQVNADFPVKTMPELIAYLKANPGKFNMATSGIGATNHMAAEMFRAKTGLHYTIVPYRGGAQAGQDLAAGNAQMMFSASLEAIPFLQSGRTRAIAISSLKRSPSFPEIPTVAESSDLKDFDVVFWQGLVVPAGTPKPIQDKLHATLAKITAEPAVIERFKKQGVEIRSSTPAQFKEWYLLEEKRWVTLIKEQKLKAE